MGVMAHQRLSPQDPNVPRGIPRSSSHTAEPPRTTTPADTPETIMTVRIAVARATEPLVVPPKTSQLDTYWADLQHGRRGFPARDRYPEFVRSQGQNKIQRSLWGAAAKRSPCLAKRTPAVSYL